MTMKKQLSIIVLFLFYGSIFGQEVGLQLYSLRNQFKNHVPATLKTISDWGITKIEGGGTYGMSKEDFNKLLSENNLDVVSVGASFDDLENDPEKAVQNARDFGAKYVMCAWIPHDDNKFDLDIH